jgi:hypothetical protein
VRSLLALALLAAIAPGCRSSSSDIASHRLELLASRRNPESGLGSTDDDQGLFGLNYVPNFANSDLALDLGVRVGEFERVDGDETTYTETHAGMRWRFAGSRHALQPYLGLGLLWNGRGSSSKRFDTDPHYDEDDNDDDLFVWIFAQSSPYASLGVDLVLGPVSLGVGVRAVCGDGVDLSARHPDEFALDVFATLGVAF